MVKKKKEYRRPEVTEVQLLAQSPVMADCQSPGLAADGFTCQAVSTFCVSL